ncbi:LysE/ArgO family amino acid transporter [Aquitalea denitrificans]|uniref:LysE/ArgO family amino acid transporter n=1 Tax=Aquitalea denitrificans TaxID=519081 RepID=UPI001358D88B|nr:LysE family transporter [Aquitalea denitrificans]
MTLQISALFEGFLLGAGLFSAMGPKDSFVIRQALVGRHVPAILFICVFSDMLLICFGVAGVGSIVSNSKSLITAATWGGSIYLTWYGIHTLLNVIKNKSMPSADNSPRKEKSSLIASAVILSLFNPYSLIDTVVIIGSISGAKGPDIRWYFAFGTMAASLIWFTLLAIITRTFRPLFSRPLMWTILDIVISLIMFYLSFKLLVD